jgi:hypothetical protein
LNFVEVGGFLVCKIIYSRGSAHFSFAFSAWNEVVLPNFRYAVDMGPINWEKRPTLPPVARTLKANFARP